MLILTGIAAYCSVGLAESSASPFLLAQERNLGGFDYQTLPRLYAVILVILCAANLFFILRARKKSPVTVEGDGTRPDRRLVLRTIGTAVLLAAYTLLLPYISFFAATAVFMFLLFRLYGRRNLFVNGGIALTGSFVFWFFFVKVANLSI